MGWGGSAWDPPSSCRCCPATGSKVTLTIEAGLYKGTYPSRVEDVDAEAVGLAHR